MKLCPFCLANNVKSEMVLHHTAIFHTYWDTSRSVGIYSRDESWKCLNCEYVAKFGHPITKREYDETFKRWGSHIEIYHYDTETIKKRLQALGYLDVDK